MRLWKRFTYVALVVAVLFVALVGFVAFTFPWEVAWIKSATSLTLGEPEETLTAANLHRFLEGFESDNLGQFGLRYTLSARKGHFRIAGETYPIELVEDKWLGDVLLVRCRWKTLLVHRRWKAPSRLRQPDHRQSVMTTGKGRWLGTEAEVKKPCPPGIKVCSCLEFSCRVGTEHLKRRTRAPPIQLGRKCGDHHQGSFRSSPLRGPPPVFSHLAARIWLRQSCIVGVDAEVDPLDHRPLHGGERRHRAHVAKYRCTVRLLVPIAWAISETLSPFARSSRARSGSPFVVPSFRPL